MSTEPSELATDWDSIRNTLASIRASQGDLRASVFGALADIEGMMDELLAHEVRNEHRDTDQQIAQLTRMVAEMAEFASDSKRIVTEGRLGSAKEMRQLRAQVCSLQKKRSGG